MQQQQRQGEVVHKVALLGKLDVSFVLLMDLAQEPAASPLHDSHPDQATVAGGGSMYIGSHSASPHSVPDMWHGR